MVVPPMNEDGTPNPNGEPVKTPAYYAAQKVNLEVQKFDHVFLRYNWDGTMVAHHQEKEKSMLIDMIEDYQSPRVLSFEAEDEAILGCQKDENGYDGFVVVNVTDPGKNISNKVSLQFADADEAICYIHGEEHTIALDDGKINFELESGQGIFIIPIKNA
jgi:hypothetical protein